MTEIEGFNPRTDPFLQFVTDTTVLLRIVFVDTSQNGLFRVDPCNLATCFAPVVILAMAA